MFFSTTTPLADTVEETDELLNDTARFGLPDGVSSVVYVTVLHPLTLNSEEIEMEEDAEVESFEIEEAEV